ncbi:MAG: hypothetical protein KFB96_25685 [Thiocapsa sp.]|uniref:hypothetical protein n=1 Tax=Thiocapsa sp. TaxID=2024551 RepID=UPI001BCD6A08|nr:hypothetical protein [Thiocapsa sp.]QVL48884.1 MAG: hypothetical protein KFB96_25685 [Thiocapsa sp.]
MDGTLDANEVQDSLGDPAAVLKAAWSEHGPAIDARSDLRTWLRLKCFKDVHRTMYVATASGKKDYDWPHLAMRYWPERVDAKCRQDPSLGVAHGSFWAYHPARAWAWELRLQDEIAPDFRIEEAPYHGDGGDREHRAAYLAEHWEDALAAITKEVLRRRRKKKAPQPELTLLEPGLWSKHPAECWQLELDIIAKQSADFHLRAPDEPATRAAFEQSHPELVAERETLLMELTPIDGLMFGDIDEAVCDEAEDSP